MGGTPVSRANGPAGAGPTRSTRRGRDAVRARARHGRGARAASTSTRSPARTSRVMRLRLDDGAHTVTWAAAAGRCSGWTRALSRLGPGPLEPVAAGPLCVTTCPSSCATTSSASRTNRPEPDALDRPPDFPPRGVEIVCACRARRARSAAAVLRSAGRIGGRAESHLPRHWRRLPGRLPRRARRRRRRGHRPGGVPAALARARSLRPPPAVRALAAPDRRQPRDRLGARAGAAAPRSATRARARAARRPRRARAVPERSSRRSPSSRPSSAP